MSSSDDLEALALRKGFASAADYLRALHNSFAHHFPDSNFLNAKVARTSAVFRTKFGTAYSGDSLDWLGRKGSTNKIDLIITSPPFGLLRKKSYGNASSEEYLRWFRPFALGFKKVLKENGSLVIDVGGSWNRGSPSRSLYHFDLLIMLVREMGFYLCQEFYWWNPSKLPSPAEWVNIRRVRVKDAINTVWWLSKTPYPKASNKRILGPYSDSMIDIFRRGYHRPGSRPSGHELSNKFIWNNGGGIPPNLIALANTSVRRTYFDYCRSKNLPVHPARFPVGLPSYFIKFLTNKGDLVLDPFAGSLTTGYAAQRLGRRWINIDLNKKYVEGGRVRFSKSEINAPDEELPLYRIFGPRYNRSSSEDDLSYWGGRLRD